MTRMDVSRHQPTRWLRYAALSLAFLWAAWWTFFGLASGMGEGLKLGGIALHTVFPGVIFLLSVVIAWRWEKAGPVVLLAEGVLVLVAYPAMTYNRFPLSTMMFVLLTMALPPLAAGFLLLAAWRKTKTK